MKWQKLMADSFGQVTQEAERMLEGLTAADVLRQPDKDSNSIGWLVWHLTRVQDSSIAMMAEDEQLWIKDSWYKKFKRKADPNDIGSGQSSADIAAFYAPDVKTLLGYLRAVAKRTEEYLSGLSASGLDKTVKDTFFKPPPTVGVFLVMTLSDNLQHIGQVGYARGLLKGKGWQPW